LYSSNADAGQPRSFALLAEMLTGLVASLEGGPPAAVETGRAWGRHLVDRPAPSQRLSADAALERLNAVLDGIGFAPAISDGASDLEVRLHHCPFREVAERHTDVVCALHLGLMQGALEELRAPLKAVSLEPFVTPSLCIGRLRKYAGDPADHPAHNREERS
jgi:predicted ArsR family transcriptional regulator